MAKNNTCIHCGANLDFGEKCTCIANEKTRDNGNCTYYRQFPQFGQEEKLDAISVMKEMLS